MPRNRQRNRPILRAKKVIHKIAQTLKKRSFRDEVGIQVTEIFLGGSVGQGTAVTGHYDLDLVLYSRDLHHETVVREGYSDILLRIESYLDHNLGFGYTFMGYNYFGGKRVAIKFSCNIPEGGKIETDLLLSPYWENRDSYYRDLRGIENPKDRRLFSVSASKYQTRFVKSTPIRVRELIQRAKAWRNVEWKDDVWKPKSYLITLLVITAYDRVSDHLKQAKFKVLAREVTKKMIKIVEEISSGVEEDLIIPGADMTWRTGPYSDLLPNCPRIVDPANSPNNVYLSGIQGPDSIEKRWNMLSIRICKMDITITAERMMRLMM